MAKKSTFNNKNNFPLLVTLVVVVFVIPLTVFAVTFQSLFLGAMAKTEETIPPVKETKTLLGVLQKKTVNKANQYYLFTTNNISYNLKPTATINPNSFNQYVGKDVLVYGWFNLNKDTLFVVALNPAVK